MNKRHGLILQVWFYLKFWYEKLLVWTKSLSIEVKWKVFQIYEHDVQEILGLLMGNSDFVFMEWMEIIHHRIKDLGYIFHGIFPGDICSVITRTMVVDVIDVGCKHNVTVLLSKYFGRKVSEQTGSIWYSYEQMDSIKYSCIEMLLAVASWQYIVGLKRFNRVLMKHQTKYLLLWS